MADLQVFLGMGLWRNRRDNVLAVNAAERFRTFGPTSPRCLMAPSEAFCSLSDGFVDYLYDHREPVLGWFTVGARDAAGRIRADVLDYFAARMTVYLHRHNQFIVIDSADASDLREVYALFVDRFAQGVRAGRSREHLAASLGAVLGRHREELARYVQGLRNSNGGGDFVFAEAVNAEYAPAMQLGLLGVEIGRLREPVLDIGCGPDASLVAFLRRCGKTAVGIDRAAGPAEGVAKADWFDLSLGPNQWGTIISHMAFSTHFLHHHLRTDGHAQRYAALYLNVLAALKPGGSLLYTPGLPFMENLLPPETYAVHRRPVHLPPDSPMDTAFRHHLGTSIAYASRVVKR